MYAPNRIVSKYIKQKLIELKGELHKSTIIIGHFNKPLLRSYRTADKNSVRKGKI